MYGGDSVMSHSHLENNEMVDVPGATNVKYILRGTRTLRLIVNLAYNGGRGEIAKAQDACIDDIPVKLSFSVKAPTAIPPNSFKELEDVGPNTKWSVDGNLLTVVIDLSGAPKMIQEKSSGKDIVLASIRANTRIGKSGLLASMKLFSIKDVKWPLLLSPRSGAEPTDDASLGTAVVRMLEFSPSPSVPRLGKDPYANHSEVIHLDDFITLDRSRFPILRLYLNVEGKDGQVMSFTGGILSGIGISLSVEVYKKTEMPPDSLRRREKKKNVEVYEEHGDSGENFLVIEFDSSKGNQDASENTRRTISIATRLAVQKRYVVNFTATGPISELPTFPEVFDVVSQEFGLTENPLAALDMAKVREAVGNAFPVCKMSRELKNIIWEAVRLYIIKDFLPHERYGASVSPEVLTSQRGKSITC